MAKVIKVACAHSPRARCGHIGQYTKVKADCHQWHNRCWYCVSAASTTVPNKMGCNRLQ